MTSLPNPPAFLAILRQTGTTILVTSLLALTLSPINAQTKVDFEKQIKPLFEKHCVRCHGPKDQEGGFRIDDRDDVLGNWVVGGDVGFSVLYTDYIATDDQESLMPPPNEGGPMPGSEIALIKSWIEQGANWPETVQVALVEEVVKQVEEAIAEEQKEKDAEQDNFSLATEITGLLHPLILHFPMALLIGGALFAIFGFRGESPMSDAAYYCLWLGALTSILACLSGWYFAIEKDMTTWQRLDFNESIDLHRWGGIAIAVLAFLLALVAASSRRRDPYGTGASWKLGMVLLAGLVGFVGHHGGKMTHDGLHDKLFNKSMQLYENVSGNKPVAPKADPGNDKDGEAQDESKGADAASVDNDGEKKDDAAEQAEDRDATGKASGDDDGGL